MKLHHVVSLRLGLQGVKIAQNVVKVGVHSYLSNRHPNLWSNFNSEKLVRSETSSFIFGRVGLEGIQKLGPLQKLACTFLYQMSIEIYDQIWTPRIWSKFKLHHLRNWSKVKLPCVVLLRLCLKRVKIFCNIVKVNVQSCLSNGHPNLWANFNSEKLLKS